MQDIVQAALLGLLVFVSRFVTRGPVYFVDGPRLTQCIRDRTFVIQPPGYWLDAHLGGLFLDPGFGLTLINEIFSAAGVAVFFLLCRKFDLDRKMSWAASLLQFRLLCVVRWRHPKLLCLADLVSAATCPLVPQLSGFPYNVAPSDLLNLLRAWRRFTTLGRRLSGTAVHLPGSTIRSGKAESDFADFDCRHSLPRLGYPD
jgi:hypothetical protein